MLLATRTEQRDPTPMANHWEISASTKYHLFLHLPTVILSFLEWVANQVKEKRMTMTRKLAMI
jgi:hypothetical protein